MTMLFSQFYRVFNDYEMGEFYECSILTNYGNHINEQFSDLQIIKNLVTWALFQQVLFPNNEEQN